MEERERLDQLVTVTMCSYGPIQATWYLDEAKDFLVKKEADRFLVCTDLHC